MSSRAHRRSISPPHVVVVGYIVIIFIIFLIIFIIIFLIILTIFFNNIFSSFLYSKKSAKNQKKIILGRSIGATMQKRKKS